MMVTPLYTQLQPEIDKALIHYGSTVPMFVTEPGTVLPAVDWVGILTKFIGSVTNLAGQVVGASPEDRRQIVIDATMAFYKQSIQSYLATAIGHPFIFNTFIGPAIERALPAIIGQAYDALTGMLVAKPSATADATPTFTPY